MTPGPRTFDVIVVGAGVAGSVLASQLSEDPGLSVALVEAGTENEDDIGRSQGAFFLTWGGPRNWNVDTVGQPGLGGRRINHPQGRAVGGSSVLNVGAWLRGRPEDYDAWEQAGAAGWNGEDAVRVFRAVEHTTRGPAELRGDSGPIRLTDLPTPTALSDVLQTAYVQAGLGARGDANGAEPFVVDRYQTLFVDGVRHTIADAFLDAAVRARPNLTVLTDARVDKVVIDDGRAVGVDARIGGVPTRLDARQEIVLSAGTLNTPRLLMLSGVGPAEHLTALGLDVVTDSPGVGGGLQDHLAAAVFTLAGPGITGSVPPDLSPASLDRWLDDHTGPAAYWTGNGVGYAALPGSTLPDFELLLDYTPAPAMFPGVEGAEHRSGAQVQVVLLQPRSRGTVRLASSDPSAAPIVDPAYLGDRRDLDALVAGLRLAHRVAQAPALAPWAEAITPDPSASDDELAAHVAATASTVFHPVGTARMGRADDPSAVVTPDLRVKGVQNLRVADASVLPGLNRGHTMAPAVYVGFRAAELITERSSVRLQVSAGPRASESV